MPIPFARLVPTRRAVILLAAAAPLALLLATLAPGTWVMAPALGAAFLALVLADAMFAGRVAEIGLEVPSDVEVGHDCILGIHARFERGSRTNVQAAFELDPRLIAGGRAEIGLSRKDGERAGVWTGAQVFAPLRRGTGTIDNLWLRWSGPLGLGARQVRQTRDEQVRVWPNIAEARSPALQTFLKDSQFGTVARRIRGAGTQFESLTEYQPGMDRRRIDWKASARHVQLYAKEFEAERNNQIVFAVDCGQSMCEPIDGVPRIDRAVSAALATSYVALKGGDKVSLFGFAAHPGTMTPFVSHSRDFILLQRAAADLDYEAQEPNYTLALATLAERLKRRSLIVVFSEFGDPTSAALMIESMGRLASRHLVLFVTMADAELEDLSSAEPADMETLSMAVTADSLLRQRTLVTRKLHQLGVDVVEAPYNQIGTRLIDAYLAIKRAGAIG